MTGGAVLNNALPALLVSRMRGLANAGFTLVPLGGGNDGKSPLCAFTGKGPTLRQTLGLMRERGSQAYGIRLDGHLVADADDTSPDILAAIEERLGTASVEVATPRGRHFWYRHDGSPVASLRLEGWPIDLKQGERAYVVGPGSIRPDGGEYVPLVGDLGRSALRPAKTSAPRVPSNKAEVGTRHVFLCKRARAYAPVVLTPDELRENLLHDRDELCETGGEPMPDAEVIKIADWAWSLRAEGKLYEGRASQVRVTRANLDALLSRPGGETAFALHTLLDAAHGHQPGKRFALDFDAMKSSGLICFGRDRFRAAVALLLELGLLRKVGQYIPGRQSQHFQLGRLAMPTNEGQSPEAQATGGGVY